MAESDPKQKRNELNVLLKCIKLICISNNKNFTAFGNLIAPLEDASLTSTFSSVRRENGTETLTDVAFATAHIVHAIFVELLRVDKQMTIFEYLLSQL